MLGGERGNREGERAQRLSRGGQWACHARIGCAPDALQGGVSRSGMRVQGSARGGTRAADIAARGGPPYFFRIAESRTAAVRNVHRISVRTAFLFGADLGNPVRDPSPGVISAPPSRFLGRVGGPSRSDPASTRAPPPEVGFWGAHFEMESEPRCPRSELTLSEK